MFSIYIIQLNDTNKLHINYCYSSSSPAQKYQEFIKKYKKFADSKLREDLLRAPTQFKIEKDALKRAKQLIKSFESEGYEVISGTPLYNPYWQTYVIQLDGPKHVYVGQTEYPPEIRFSQHRLGFRSSKGHVMKAKNPKLLKELYLSRPTLVTKEKALQAEKMLVKELEFLGYKVEWG